MTLCFPELRRWVGNLLPCRNQQAHSLETDCSFLGSLGFLSTLRMQSLSQSCPDRSQIPKKHRSQQLVRWLLDFIVLYEVERLPKAELLGLIWKERCSYWRTQKSSWQPKFIQLSALDPNYCCNGLQVHDKVRIWTLHEISLLSGCFHVVFQF